jgi:hypothetical protein
MTYAQKSDFVFRRNGRLHLNRRGASVSSTTGSRGVRISGSNAGYTMFRGSVKSTGYPLHSPVSPSLPLPCVTLCHHISTGLYFYNADWTYPSTLQSVRPYPEGRWKPGSSKDGNKRYGSWLGLVIPPASDSVPNTLRPEAGVENCCENKFVWLLRIPFVRREQTPVLLHSAHVSFSSRNLRNDFSITEHNTQFCTIF